MYQRIAHASLERSGVILVSPGNFTLEARVRIGLGVAGVLLDLEHDELRWTERREPHEDFGSNTAHCVSRAIYSSMKTVNRRTSTYFHSEPPYFGAARHADFNLGRRLVKAARCVGACIECGVRASVR